MEDETEINWADIEATAVAADSRRRGIDTLNKLYTMDPDVFYDWLKSVPSNDHFDMILALLSACEFFVETNARSLKTKPEMLLKCLLELAENE